MNGYWAGKTVLVTGCTGFVGAWLTERLIQESAKVVGLIWETSPDAYFYRQGLDRRITCVPGDISDFPLLRRITVDHAVDTVFHLAAQAIVTTANTAPLETLETNTRGTWLLLETLRDTASVQRIVVASSDKVYGDQEPLPYTEGASLLATNPYDVSKACADLISQSYAKAFGLPIGIVRCGNIYGGGDLNFDRLIPGTISAAFSGKNPLIRSDGTFTRDYLHVADAIQAYLLVGQAMDDSRFHGGVFNFGNERPYTVLEIVRMILELMERSNLGPIVLNTATNEIRHQYLSASKARGELGWIPAYSLERGLRETIPWYEAFLGDGPGQPIKHGESRETSGANQ